MNSIKFVKPNVSLKTVSIPNLLKNNKNVFQVKNTYEDVNFEDYQNIDDDFSDADWQHIFDYNVACASNIEVVCKETVKDLQERKKELEKNFQKFRLTYVSVEDLSSGDSVFALTPEEYRNQKMAEMMSMSSYVDGLQSYDDLVLQVNQMTEEYQESFEKAFEANMGFSYQDYQQQLVSLEQDISFLKAYKYSLDQQLKVLPYLAIVETNEYQDFVSNYKNDYDLANFDINSAPSVGVDAVMVAETLEQDGKNLASYYPYCFFNTSLKSVERYEVLSEDEKMMYHFLFKNKGFKEANQYIIALEDSINSRVGIKNALEFVNSVSDLKIKLDDMSSQEEFIQKCSELNISETDITNYLKTSGKGIADGINTFGDGINKIFDKEGMISSTQYGQMLVLSAFAQNNKNILSGTYEISVSAGNMLPSMAAGLVAGGLGASSSVVSWIGYGSMGASVVGNSKNEALVSGNAFLPSLLFGLGSGASELFLGKLLGNMGVLNENAQFALQQILNESVEESLQEVVESQMKSVILDEKVDYAQLPSDMIKAGLYGGILSAVSTGSLSGVNILFQGVDYNLTMDQALELAMEMQESSDTQDAVLSSYLSSQSFTSPKDVTVNQESSLPKQSFWNKLASKFKGQVQSLKAEMITENDIDEYYNLMENPVLKTLFSLKNSGKDVSAPPQLQSSFARLLELHKSFEQSVSVKNSSNVQSKLSSSLGFSRTDSVKSSVNELIELLNTTPQLKKYMFQTNNVTLEIPNNLSQAYINMQQLVAKISNAGYSSVLSKMKSSITVSYPQEIFAVSDLHGNINLYQEVVKQLKDNPRSHFYVLGDVMDRGTSGLEILLNMKELSDKGRITYIPGNHDVEFYNYMRGIVDGTKNKLFQNAEGFYEVNGFFNETENLKNFNSFVQNLYSQGKISNKITLSSLSNWLGSQPLQRVASVNNQKYVLAHAVFDSKLYNYNKNFNLSDFYSLSLNNVKSEIYNRAKNILWYREGTPSTHMASLSVPIGYEMIVGHTPQNVANKHTLDSSGKLFANYIDTHDSNFSAFDLTMKRPFTLSQINSVKIMDEILSKMPEAISINMETLKLNETLFQENLRKISTSLGSNNDPQLVNLFCQSLEKIYSRTSDVNVEYMIENLYKILPDIHFYSTNILDSTKLAYEKKNSIYLNEFLLKSDASVDAFSHELGHAFHDVLFNKSLPDNFQQIMDDSMKRIQTQTANTLANWMMETNTKFKNRQAMYASKISNNVALKDSLKQTYVKALNSLDSNALSNYVNNVLVDYKTIDSVSDFLVKKNLNNVAMYLTRNDFIGKAASDDILSSVFSKQRIFDDSKISNIFGHSSDYYQSNYNRNAEMVADYFQLKIYGCTEEITKLTDILGVEWYNMMESQMNRFVTGLQNR